MAEYTERDFSVAQGVIRGLLNHEVNTRGLNDNVAIADIEGDAAQFIDDLRFLAEIGIDVPAMRIGEEGQVIPIALRHFWEINNFNGIPPGRYWWRRHSRYYEDWYDLRDELYRAIEKNETRISREEAPVTFERLAVRFLANRIAGARELRADMRDQISFLNLFQKQGGKRIAAPGCTFSVSTNNSGLRVLWSGGYIISGRFFAAPTSPVSSTLQAGTYAFGVDGGAYGNTPQWDTTALVTLPGNPSIHLNF